MGSWLAERRGSRWVAEDDPDEAGADVGPEAAGTILKGIPAAAEPAGSEPGLVEGTVEVLGGHRLNTAADVELGPLALRREPDTVAAEGRREREVVAAILSALGAGRTMERRRKEAAEGDAAAAAGEEDRGGSTLAPQLKTAAPAEDSPGTEQNLVGCRALPLEKQDR